MKKRILIGTAALLISALAVIPAALIAALAEAVKKSGEAEK